MEKNYRIAGIIISLETPFDFKEDMKYKKFSVNLTDRSRIDYSVSWEAAKLPILQTEAYMEISDKRYYETETDWIEECWEGAGKVPFRWLYMQKLRKDMKNTQYWTCRYRADKEQVFKYTSILFHNIGFPIMLDEKKVLLFHCSFIRKGRAGILFSGPSGMGKSTQARLWEKYENAEVLNGDRAAIRKSEGRWKAFGLPYAGSSDIFKNESARVGAVIVLRQSKGNQVEKLSPGKAYCAVWSELFQSNASSILQRTVAETAEQFIREVPVYQLSCQPNKEAVECLKNFLTEEGVLWT